MFVLSRNRVALHSLVYYHSPYQNYHFGAHIHRFQTHPYDIKFIVFIPLDPISSPWKYWSLFPILALVTSHYIRTISELYQNQWRVLKSWGIPSCHHGFNFLSHRIAPSLYKVNSSYKFVGLGPITIWLWLTVSHGKSPFLIGKPSINGPWLPWLC